MELLHDPCPGVRQAALGSIHDHFMSGAMHKTNVTLTLLALDCAIQDVVTSMKSKDKNIAATSAHALSALAAAGCHDPRLVEALFSGLQSEDARIVEYCADGLTTVPAGTVFEELFAAYAARQPVDGPLRYHLLRGIWLHAGSEPGKLYKKLGEERVAHRRAAAMCLGDLMSRRSDVVLQETKCRKETVRKLEERRLIEDDSTVNGAIDQSISRIRKADELDRTAPLR